MFQSFNPAPSVEFSLCAASVAKDPKFGSLKPFSAMNVNQKDKENVCDSRPENLTIISARPISNVAPQKLASQQAGKPESYTKPTASSRDKSKQGFVPNSAGGKMQWNASCNLESVRRPCAVAPSPPGQGQSVQIAALLGQINAQQRQLEALQRDLDMFKNQPRESEKSGSVLQDVTSNLNNLAISAQNGGSRELVGVAVGTTSNCPKQNSEASEFEGGKPLKNVVSQGVQCSLCCCDQKRDEEADSKTAAVVFVDPKEDPVKRPANGVSDEPSINRTEPPGKTMTDQEKEFFMEMKRKLSSKSQAPVQRFVAPEMALMNARAIDACDNRLTRRDAFPVAPSAQVITQLDDANNGQMASSVSIHMNALAGKYLQQLPAAPTRRQSQDFSPGKSSMFSVSVAKKAVTTVKQFSFYHQQVPSSAATSAETEAEQHLQRVRALQQTALQFDSGGGNFSNAPPRALTYEGAAANFAPGGIYQRADPMNLQRAGGQFQYQQQPHMRQQDPIPFLSTIEECSSEFYYSPPGSMRPASCVCEGFPRNRSDCAQCMRSPPFY